MQNKWIRFIKGCLVIKLGGDYLERFLNMCRLHNIYLWDIRRSEDICYCELYASDFFRLPPLLRKTGTKVKVMKKRGIPFYIPFLKKRIIFFIGVASCLIMLNVVTDYVWAIEYIGNLQISDDELTDFLEEQEIHYGMRKDSLDCEAKEKKLRETFPTVTWTSIYFEGTKLYIEIKENEKSEPVEIKTKGMDIVADASGTITSILTRNGVPKVKAGETVEEGQILVAGGVPVYNEAQNTTPAQMKMFLTRIGFGSKVVVTGDSSQKDLAAGVQSGLDVAQKVLSKISDIAFIQLTSSDVVRHPLVQKIVKAYEDYEKKINDAHLKAAQKTAERAGKTTGRQLFRQGTKKGANPYR